MQLRREQHGCGDLLEAQCASGGSLDLAGARASWGDLEETARPDVRRLARDLADWIETFYVGLPEVRARGFDPVAALRAARRIGDVDRALRELGDRHTFVTYRRARRRGTADDGMDQVGTLELPVRVGVALASDEGLPEERFWITEVAAPDRCSKGCELPRRGDEVTHWNGVPLARVVRRLGKQLRGAHPSARRRLGLRALTRRVIDRGRLPDEDWVVLTCRRRGRPVDHRLEWSEGGLRWTSGHRREDRRSGDRVRIGQLGEPDDMAELLVRLRAQRSSGRPLLLDLRGNAGGSVHGTLAVFQAITGVCGTERVRFQFRASDRLQQAPATFAPWHRDGVAAEGYLPPHRIEDSVTGLRSGWPSDGAESGTRGAPGPDLRRVAVLVDASTFSAAEILTAMLRAEGATVLGTDECTGGGPDNPWTVDALRRLCPADWIELRGTGGASKSLRAYCTRRGYRIGASWTDATARYWRLCSRGRRSANRLAVAGAGFPTRGIAVYDLDGSLGSAAGFEVDLQLSVRRPLIRVADQWVPIREQTVDHVLRPTRRDLLEDDTDLLDTAFRFLSREARVARSGSETPPSSGEDAVGGSTQETSP